MQGLNDFDLVARIKQNDAEAEAELIRRFHPKIAMVARKQVGNSNEDIDDIVQEALIAMILSLREGRYPANAKTSLASYIFGIAQNKIRDYYNQKTRNQRLQEAAAAPIILIHKELDLEKKERYEYLERSIKKLPKKYQIVLRLRFLEEWSVGEISQTLDLPKRRVSERINYAVKLLRNIFKKTDIFSIFMTVFILSNRS